MASVNKVIIIGNLGRDPEIRTLPNGDAVANITVATTEKWKDKNTGEMKEQSEWHRVNFFGRLAEIVGEYVKKGDPIYIEGSIHTRKWTDKDGIERYSTEIKGSAMQLLGSRRESTPAPSQGGSTTRPQTTPQRPDQQVSSGFDDMDDSVPF